MINPDSKANTMTIRDRFAVEAMRGILNYRRAYTSKKQMEAVCAEAYQIADEMILHANNNPPP